MKKLYPLFLLLLFSLPSLAQVTTEPEFPLQDAPLTIYYDATQGTSGLSGAEKVYMHAGVILSGPEGTGWENVVGNWGKDDGLGQMQKVEGQANLWKITIPSPREYFNVDAGKRIYRIGMVFRNADGTKEGKDPAGGDIFVEVYESGFNLNVSSPNVLNGDTVTIQNSSFSLSANTNEPANFFLYVNQQLVREQTAVTAFEASLPTAETGTFSVRLEASTATETKEVTFSYLVLPQPEVVALPAGVEQGINIRTETSATFVLLAPQKEFVLLMGDFNNFEPSANYVMNKTPDGELFWLTVNNLNPDTEYAYYYLVDGEIDIADPYSETVLDAGEDQHINEKRYPGLRSFPAEAGTDRLTVFQTNEADYTWQVENFTPPAKEDLVIYELLVRDFTTAESFQGVIDRLDYLDSLNITAIQLLPVMEFNGNNSWGYNPTFQTAVDKWYGPKEKLKELIDKAHQRGMAVILDIALNHQDYPNPFLKMWWQGNTASPENPFFNVTPKHPFNVFTDMNHESPYTQDFVDHVTRYWLEEYKVDGFRFDLSKGFTQTNYGDDVGAWSSYDASRVALLKRMADEVWSVDADAYVILEHFAANNEETELANYGMMLWGNLNHNYGEALMGWQLDNNKSSFNWLSYQVRGWNDPNVVGYIESHDEERLLFKAQEFGNSRGDYSTKNLETALERAELAAAFFIPVPGPKMLWQFQELGYDISIDENGRTGKKPVKWEYLEEPARQELFRTFSELNYLKTTYPVFGTEDFEMPGLGAIRTLKLNDENMNVVVVGNFGLEAQEASFSFQHTGWWYSYFEKDSLEAVASTSLTLAPGEFRLFTDQPIFYRGVADDELAVEESWLSEEIKVYPNPGKGRFNLVLPEHITGSVQLRLLDTSGRTLWEHQIPAGTERKHIVHLHELKPGFYALELTYGGRKGVKRILLQ